MFSSSPLEKKSAAPPESFLPGRNYVCSNRFSVGIAPINDENQQNIRIQLAVHKYNNSNNLNNNYDSNVVSKIKPVNHGQPTLSPFKFTLVRNTTKSKICEEDAGVKNYKKATNRYLGVGNFPTVQLNKAPVLSRPVKRYTSSNFRVHLPELPVNRFLNHLDDTDLDLKSPSTRSVLDVLQDLSRKRIHSKDDIEDASQRKSKGLGGDGCMNIEAPYKPLFVARNRNSVAVTRDNTTQTLDMTILSDISYSTNVTNVVPNVTSDPRAELRKKLARQNNEISASLSSSVLLSYPTKRKLDNILTTKNELDDVDNGVKKKPRLYMPTTSSSKNVEDKSLDLLKRPLEGNCGKNTSSKSLDLSPKASPNKDRMMTIFLDMQNTNSKSTIFQASDQEPKHDREEVVNISVDSPKKTVTFAEEVLVLSGSGDSKSSLLKDCNFPNFNFFATSDTNELNDAETNRNAALKTSEATHPGSPSLSFKISSSLDSDKSKSFPISSNFKIPLTSTVSSPLSEKPIFSTGLLSNQDQSAKKKDLGSPVPTYKLDVFNVSPDASKKCEGELKTTTNNKFSAFEFGSLKESSAHSRSEKASSELESATSNTVSFNFGTFESGTPKSATVSLTNTEGNPFTFGQGVSTKSELAPLAPAFSYPSDAAKTANIGMKSTSLTETLTFGQKAGGPEFPSRSQITSNPIISFGQNTSMTRTGSNSGTSSSVSSAGPLGFRESTPPTSEVATTTEQLTAHQMVSTLAATGQSSAFNSTSPRNYPFGATTMNQGIFFGPTSVNSSLPVEVTATTTTTSSLGQTCIPFGQATVGLTSDFGQTVTTPINFVPATISQTKALDPITPASSFRQTSLTSTSNYGQATTTAATAFDQTVTRQGILFPENRTTGSETLEQNIQANPLFAFGQKPMKQKTDSSFGLGNKLTNEEGISRGPSGTAQNNIFGQNKNLTFTFGQKPTSSDTSSATTITLSTTFGETQSSFGPSSLPLGQHADPSSSQTASNFGQNSGFGQATLSFSQSKPNFPAKVSPFGQSSIAQTTAPTFGSVTQPALNSNSTKPINSFSPNCANFFGQSGGTQPPLLNQGFGTASPFTSNAAEESFGQKPTTPFGLASTAFGQTTGVSSFGQGSPFSFGSTTSSSGSNSTPATASTTTSIFSFVSATNTSGQAPSFNFGSSSVSAPSGSQSPFAFGSQITNPETFKFGGSATSNTPANPQTFNFGAQTTNNNAATTETPAKSATSPFSFGSAKNSGFNFSADSPTPVFSFGGSGSTATCSSSTFTFGSPQPSGMFGQNSTPTPSSPFAVPGTFSIGSGSSQSRPRASNRYRRRP